MKALIILENGFEDTEALATYDVLKRGGISLVSASLNDKIVLTQCGHNIEVNTTLKDLKNPEDEFDFLVIPGGKAVMNILTYSKEIDDLIDGFIRKNKLIASICAAPSLIGKRGYFEGLEYTCFPGCDENIKLGTRGKDGVIISGNFITATSMYYSVEFGLTIIEKLYGLDARNKLENSLKGYK